MSTNLDYVKAEIRVAEGEAFLDNVRPDWRKKAWPPGRYWRTFQVSDPKECLLCIIEGGTFLQALCTLDITHRQAIAFGFLRDNEKDPKTFYADLERAWSKRSPPR